MSAEAVEPRPSTFRRIVSSGPPSDPGTTCWYACGHCGRPADPTDHFCRFCGYHLDVSTFEASREVAG